MPSVWYTPADGAGPRGPGGKLAGGHREAVAAIGRGDSDVLRGARGREGGHCLPAVFKEGYDAWGLLDKGNPFFTVRRDEWLERYAAIGIEGFIEAGERLFASGKYEEGAIAVQFIKERLADLDAEHGLALERWFSAGVANWAHADVICGEILGPMLKDGRLSLAAIAPWRASPSDSSGGRPS